MLIFRDDFTRQDETPLQLPWRDYSGAGMGLNLTGRAAIGAGGPSDMICSYGLNYLPVDQWVEGLVVSRNPGSLGLGVGLSLRGRGDFDRVNGTVHYTGYRCIANPFGYVIRRFTAGATVILVSDTTVGTSTPAGTVVRFEAEGRTLRLYFDGQIVATVVDPTPILRPGLPGLCYSSTDAGLALTNWAAGTLYPRDRGTQILGMGERRSDGWARW